MYADILGCVARILATAALFCAQSPFFTSWNHTARATLMTLLPTLLTASQFIYLCVVVLWPQSLYYLYLSRIEESAPSLVVLDVGR